MGLLLPRGRSAGEAAAITGSESGLGQVLDSIEGTMALFSPPLSEARQHPDLLVSDLSKVRNYYGLKDAKLLDKTTTGAGPQGCRQECT